MKQTSIRSGAFGVLAGLVGSLCCLGPSAAILLGLGSSSALAGFTFNRGAALAAGCALLVASLLLAWRRGRACAAPRRILWRQPALIAVSFALAYAGLAYALPLWAARQADASAVVLTSAPAPVAQATLRRATLSVEKMYCPPCASHVRALLRRKPFVHSFVAETYQEEVIVDYDSQHTSARAIVALLPPYLDVSLLTDQALQ